MHAILVQAMALLRASARVPRQLPLLASLLLVDLVLISLHVLYVLAANDRAPAIFAADRWLKLDGDLSYGLLVMLGKLSWIAFALARGYVSTRRRVFLLFALAFALVGAEVGLRVHVAVGHVVDALITGPHHSEFVMRLGGGSVLAMLALPFVVPTWRVARADDGREAPLVLVLGACLAALAAVGFGLDLLHAVLGSWVPPTIGSLTMSTADEGGELLGSSLILVVVRGLVPSRSSRAGGRRIVEAGHAPVRPDGTPRVARSAGPALHAVRPPMATDSGGR